ncbi:MAG TPA: Sua5/YciO/YrdC/YwlC family protein [Bacteriovoracaceae bacterium]|nr:Sua5/YciO/YrdC/YwlC family protein [Bacteriovoracaceae bacterium]
MEHSLDERVLQRATSILKNGGLVCFPTETNWVVVADPFLKRGVDLLYKIRHIENTKHLTVLSASFKTAMEIAVIDDHAFVLLKRVIPGSYTFIFEAKKIITKLLKASKVDHQVGIRFPPQTLCKSLLSAYDGVLLSTHLSHDMLEDADPEIPLYSAQIEDQFGGLIDLIIDPGEYEFLGHTTIVDFTTGFPEVHRIGIGDPSLFE